MFVEKLSEEKINELVACLNLHYKVKKIYKNFDRLSIVIEPCYHSYVAPDIKATLTDFTCFLENGYDSSDETEKYQKVMSDIFGKKYTDILDTYLPKIVEPVIVENGEKLIINSDSLEQVMILNKPSTPEKTINGLVVTMYPYRLEQFNEFALSKGGAYKLSVINFDWVREEKIYIKTDDSNKDEIVCVYNDNGRLNCVACNKELVSIATPKKPHDDTKHLYSARKELGVKSRFPMEDDFGQGRSL